MSGSRVDLKPDPWAEVRLIPCVGSFGGQSEGMSNPKYDASRVTDKQCREFAECYLHFKHLGWNGEAARQLKDAALVPEPPTAAELEKALVDGLIKQAQDSYSKWHISTFDVDAIVKARAREAGK